MASVKGSAAFLAERTDGFGSGIVEMSLSLRITTVVRDSMGRPRYDESTDEEILLVGGRWDCASRTWLVGEAKEVGVIRITRGGAQERAARWLAAWFEAHVTGDWPGFISRVGLSERPWSALFSGGRRSGKSHLAVAALVLYAVLYPGAIVFAVSPTIDETAELDKAIKSMLPEDLRDRRGAGAGKVLTFTLPHGAQILLLSGYKEDSLRRGRVDMALYNEGQNMSHAGYIQIRAPIADGRGGLVLIAANPPRKAIGRWVEEHQARVAGGEIDGVHFDFDPEENPWVEFKALSSIEKEVDAVTYDRDVRGIFRPIGDVVFHAWSSRESVRPVREGLVDVTAEVTQRELGVAREWVVGMDFQATPAMVAAIIKFFRDPNDPERDLLTWVVGEVIVENANENDLVDGLEAADRWTVDGYRDRAGFAGDECAVVMDASGFFQDGAHNRGKTSDLALKARGWRLLFKPQKDSARNPDILERVKYGNARLQTKDGRRHMFVTPQCTGIVRAMKLWENRHGVPYRRSPHAHIADAVTYPVYRFFGRPAKKKSDPTYHGVKVYGSRGEMDGY